MITSMKKVVVAGGVLVGLAVLVSRLRATAQGFDWQTKAFEHMETAFERMPDNAPPKWMFRNITAIRRETALTRQNTDRILDLLQRERTDQAQATDATSMP